MKTPPRQGVSCQSLCGYARWLDPDNHDTASLKPLLAPAPEEGFTEWPVSRALNNPRHEGPACAESVEKSG